MSGEIAVSSLPECNCDHDFYDGTGINFHFADSCPKGAVIDDVHRMVRGLLVLAGTFRRWGQP